MTMRAKNLHLFITGKPGAGKTTLIRKLSNYLFEKGINLTGFYTEEIRGRMKRTGFKLTTIHEDNTYILASTEPPGIPFGRYYVKKEGIDRGIRAIKRDAELYIIDEIGPMEMKNPNFMPAVNDILKSDKNVIAVIHRNLAHTVEEENLYQITIENRDHLYERLKVTIGEYILELQNKT